MDKLQFFTSKRGGEIIVHNNYIYNKTIKNELNITWRCVRRDCAGKIKTCINKKDILFFNEHYHDVETDRLVRLKINTSLNQNSSMTFDEIINHEIIKMKDSELKCVPIVRNLRTYQLKKKNKEKNIDNINEIYYKLKFTIRNDIFLQYDNLSKENRIIIFFTTETIKIFEKSEAWLCDGTFYSSPKIFSQLLIIHSIYFNKVISSVYIFACKIKL
ncbi:hypothetical protein DMUE_1666 [Dictyocoela muelleri]|nr:hypothetical protein DMUE_1666 [Dictyocoela muelleri]